MPEISLRSIIWHFILSVSFYSHTMMMPTQGLADIIRIKPGYPTGFEGIASPRLSMLDVYFGGDKIGQFKADITPDGVHFRNAGAILDALPPLRNRTELQRILQGKLPANTGALCRGGNYQSRPDCGTIEPEKIGLILDEAYLRAEIFIHPDLLVIQDPFKNAFLALPERKFAAIYTLDGAMSGSNQSMSAFGIGHRAILSRGEAKIMVESGLDNRRFSLETISASIDRRGWQAEAGLFQTTASQLLPNQDIAGIAWSNNGRSWLDSQKNTGNDIILYLPRRAFISLYRDGRLYASASYAAGNQKIDTSALPDGSYEITLRIEETGGQIREEKRQFAKLRSLPPNGRPRYLIEAGVLRSQATFDQSVPGVTSNPIVRGITSRRIGSNIGLDIGFTALKDRVLLETGVMAIHGNHQLDSNLMMSGKGDFGIQAGYRTILGRTSLSLDGRTIRRQEDTGTITQARQASMILAHQITPSLSSGLRGSYSQTDQAPENFAIGPYAEWRIWQNGENMVRSASDYTISRNQRQGSMMLYFTHKIGQNNVNSATGRSGGANIGTIQLSREHIRGDTRQAYTTGISREGDNTLVDADFDRRSRTGKLQGTVQKAWGEGESGFSYGGNFSIRATQKGGKFDIGGIHEENAAIRVSVRQKHNDTPPVKMQIMVNGVATGLIGGNESRVIYLAPFRSYKIRLTPEIPGLFEYDSRERMVTLYPGNVVPMEWVTEQFHVIVAHIRTPDGQPVRRATVENGRNQASTSDSGWLQTEIRTGETIRLVLENGKKCQLLPGNDARTMNGVAIYTNPLICRSED